MIPVCARIGIARLRARAAGPVLAAALALGEATAAEDAAPLSGPLPGGIERFERTRPACFRPGERQQLDAALDAARIAVPGCAEGVVPPQTVVQARRAYKAGTSDFIDCVSLRRDMRDTRYLDLFLKDLITQTDGPERSASCAAGMLHTWARADALAGIGEDGYEGQSRAAIMWTLAGASAAYFANPAVREAAMQIKGDGDTEILGWFGSLASRVTEDIRAKRAAEDEDNLQYWRGFSILPTALMTGDRRLVSQSRAVFAAALREVTADNADPAQNGFLPLELQRGTRSQHYQAYATSPILGMAVLSQAYGCDFLDSRWKRRRLVALMTRTMQGVFEPEVFAREVERRTGKQTRQHRSTTVRRSPDLLYLVDRLDPRLYDRIDARLSETLGRPRPVIRADRGESRGMVRMGGRYAKLADAADALRDSRAEALAPTCGQD